MQISLKDYSQGKVLSRTACPPSLFLGAWMKACGAQADSGL